MPHETPGGGAKDVPLFMDLVLVLAIPSPWLKLICSNAPLIPISLDDRKPWPCLKPEVGQIDLDGNLIWSGPALIKILVNTYALFPGTVELKSTEGMCFHT